MPLSNQGRARLAALAAGIGAAAVLLTSCTSSSTGSPASSAPAARGSSSQAPSSATASPAADIGAVGTTETVPCPPALAAGAAFAKAGTEVEGQTYSCGVVVVPEDYARPDGRTIELFYLKLHSASATPASDPLVYLAGGPGSTGSYELTANPGLYDSMTAIRNDRDIIAYDQRGTGYSNYLLCAPFESTLGILQDRDKNPEISQTITDLQGKDSGIGYGALRANLCGVGTRLLAGVDLGQYNSVNSAKDIAVLAKALGYADGYNLYGTSYGTRLAQFAMRGDPEGVRSVILDGVGGPQIPNSMWSQTKSVSPYVEIFRQCEADAACEKAYPNLAERFGALLTKLAKEPLVFDPPLKVWAPLTVAFPAELKQIDPDFFLKLARINNIAQGGGFAGSVPRIIKAAEERDVEYFRTSRLADTGSGSPAVGTTAPTGQQDRTPLLETDQPLYEAPFVTLLTLAQNAAAKGDAGLDAQWLTIVLGDLADRLKAGENQADLMEALLRLSVVPNTGTSAQQLTDFADANLSSSAAATADELVATMTRNDVRATMWSIQDVAMNLSATPDSRSYSDAMSFAFNCSDELAFTPLSVAKENLEQTPYPQLAAFPMSFNKQVLLSCLAYPTTLDRSVTDPVVSDIPSLLYLGRLDNETPIDWGRAVAKGLGNATVVEWENLGHVVAALDPKLCAAGIAAAFLDDPSTKPDLTCAQAADYTNAFVLE
jgi:pimeloyl-ACP methyl ester carboxylesterase